AAYGEARSADGIFPGAFEREWERRRAALLHELQMGQTALDHAPIGSENSCTKDGNHRRLFLKFRQTHTTAVAAAEASISTDDASRRIQGCPRRGRFRDNGAVPIR